MAPPIVRDAARSGASTSSPDPRASEEVRDLVQRRLALLGLVTLALSGGFLLIAVVGEALLDGVGVALSTLGSPRRTLNFAGAVISASVYLSTRSGQRSATQLLVVDAVGTVLAVVPYTLMSVMGQPNATGGVLLTALTVMLVLQTRALMVPSDALRTFAISLTAAVLSFALGIGAHAGGYASSTGEDLSHLALNLGMWLAVIVAVSTIASWVLFGLREQIREARRLGQYILREKIGEGGMGVVYKAQHALLRRPTAVKLLPPELAGEMAVKRFEKEVQLTASLVHPNTVTIFDYGRTADGVFYYAMEYLDGGDLAAIVEEAGPLPPSRVVHLLAQVAAGLAEAHEIGLIHRDIKPANILVAGTPPVADLAKLVDFGLVRETRDERASGLTQTDSIMGTPLYLAPEAITHPSEVDARADLYALGGVAYYLLTGRHVFEGQTVVQICASHLHEEPTPPSAHRPTPVPEALEEIVMRCLAKDRDERPPSAEVLRDLLLSCEDVGVWRASDARAWWAEHGPAIAARRAGALGHGRGTESTVAVDLGARGPR